MSSPRPTSGKPRRVVALGDALVDLICERWIDDLTQASSFVPHFGGALANVAVIAAGAGAPVALAGAAGTDVWGEWLRDRLVREGVDTSLFELRANAPGAPARVLSTVGAGGVLTGVLIARLAESGFYPPSVAAALRDAAAAAAAACERWGALD